MKRILYFHHGGSIGGAPLSLLFLIQQLDRSQYEPVVVTTRPGPVHALYKQHDIPIYLADELSGPIVDFSHTTLEWYSHRHWWPLPGRLLHFVSSARHARQIIEKLQPALVHLNSSTLAAAALGTSQIEVPLVWHIREPLATGYLGIRRAWLRQLIDRVADRVISISQYDASLLIASDRIRVIPNFVDFEQFDRATPAQGVQGELGLPPEARIIVMLGGAAEPKGTLTFIKALPLVLKEHPYAYFLVAGPAPRTLSEGGVKGQVKKMLRVDAYQRDVLRVIGETGVGAHLVFSGVRQDIPRILAASEMLVFPSAVPHFARPVIEAAAMAKPTVASDLGGPAELIVDRETGLLVRPNDSQALAEAINTLLDDPQLAAAMGEAGHKRALNLYNAAHNAQATIAVYDELLGG